MSNPTNGNEEYDFGYRKPDSGFSNGSIPISEQKSFTTRNSPQPQSTNPQYVNPQYQQAPIAAPRVKKPMSTGARVGLILGIVGVAVLLPVGIFIAFIASAFSQIDFDALDPSNPSSTSTAAPHDYLASADYYWDKETDSFTGQPYVEGNTGGGDVEALWKSGTTWKPAPAGDPQTENFSDEYVTATELLNGSTTGTNPENVSVVFSADPEINCGMKNIRITKKTVAGCYNPAYGNILFMYWGTEAPVDVRVLVLFHTYSHFAQHWDEFDTVYAAYKTPASVIDPATTARLIEQDASCRVYFGWGNADFQLYDRQLANPCGAVDDWDNFWLYYEFFDAGMTPQDY